MTYPEIPVIPPLPIPQSPLWVVQLDGVTIIDSSVIFRPSHAQEPSPSIPKRRALEWSERGRARQMRPAEVTKEEWECLLSEAAENDRAPVGIGNRVTRAASRLTEYREFQLGSVGDWVLSGYGRMLLEALRERRRPKQKPKLPVGILPPRRGR